jgi:exonuclease SbcC
MLPITMKVNNFTSYIDETIDFNEYDSPIIICGNNGNGKSSIIDMITTALYFRARGTDSRGSGMDDLINKEEKEMIVDFTFQMNDTNYEIIRKKVRNGSHSLTLLIDGVDQSVSIKETQQKINDILKMDYETFMDTVCIGQNNSASFMEKTPDKRKDVFSQILNLDKYDVLEKYTKELKKNVTAKIESISSKVSEKESMIKFKDDYTVKLAEYEKEYSKLDTKELEKELEDVTKQKIEYESIKYRNELILRRRNKLQEQIKYSKYDIDSNIKLREELKTALDQYVDSSDSVEILNKEISEVRESYTAAKEHVASINASLQQLKLELNKVKQKKQKMQDHGIGICESCGQAITEEYKKQYIDGLNSEGNEIVKKAKSLENDKTELIDKANSFAAIGKEKTQQLNDIHNIITERKNKEYKLTVTAEKISSDEKNLIELEKELEENNKADIKELEDKKFNDGDIKRKISEIRDNQQNYSNKISVLKDRLKMIAEAEKSVNELKNEQHHLEVEKTDYESLVTAFGKSGIQSLIIENTLPDIENEINDILDKLTSGKISISFITQKQTKTKKTAIDTLDIIVHDNGIDRKYESFSGGEKFRIDFSCHVGISKFLAKRADATIDMFILDEGLASQDINARTIFVDSIKMLSDRFKKILIITHIDTIKEAFDNKMLVTKDPILGSKVSKI